MEFFLKIADVYCRIYSEDKTLKEYFKQELDYSDDIKPIFAEIAIKKNDHAFIITTSDSKTKLKIPYGLKLNSNDIDYIARTHLGGQLLVKNILFLHASSVIKNGNAYIFMGPATAGKTTLMNYFSTKNRLANDTTIIKKIKNKYYVYPSPFDFRSKIYAPKKYVPLKRIFRLKKGIETEIKKMNPKDQILNIIENNLSLPKVSHKNNKITKINKNLYEIFFKKTMDLLEEFEISELHFKKNREFLDIL